VLKIWNLCEDFNSLWFALLPEDSLVVLATKAVVAYGYDMAGVISAVLGVLWVACTVLETPMSEEEIWILILSR